MLCIWNQMWIRVTRIWWKSKNCLWSWNWLNRKPILQKLFCKWLPFSAYHIHIWVVYILLFQEQKQWNMRSYNTLNVSNLVLRCSISTYNRTVNHLFILQPFYQSYCLECPSGGSRTGVMSTEWEFNNVIWSWRWLARRLVFQKLLCKCLHKRKIHLSNLMITVLV